MTYEKWLRSFKGDMIPEEEWNLRTNGGSFVPMTKDEYNHRTQNGSFIPRSKEVWFSKKSPEPMTYERWNQEYKGEEMSKEEWNLRTNNGIFIPMSKQEWNRRT